MTLYALRDDSCVLHLPMNEGSGSVVYDHSRYGNNGQIVGANWTTGKFGSCLNFDGVDDYVYISDFSNTDPKYAISVLAWVYPIEDTASILNRRSENKGCFNTDWRSWHISLEKTYMRFSYHITLWNPAEEQGKVYFTHTGSNSVSYNTWYFLALTWSNTEDAFKIFLNGELINTVPTSYQQIYYDYDDPTATSVDKRLFIGDFDGADCPGKKLIDEIRVYNRALSEAEIKSLYLYYQNFEVRPCILCPRPTI